MILKYSPRIYKPGHNERIFAIRSLWPGFLVS